MKSMVVAELVFQLDISSLKVVYVEQKDFPAHCLSVDPNKHSNPSVTLLVSQPLMSPYVAAAVVGSLHHALTAVPMSSLVMGVTVGFGVGASVIVGPGVLVGAGVGAGVGADVVGTRLGSVVGTAVIVGRGVGASVGTNVVGTGIGKAEGAAVIVGIAVIVGAGVIVGEGVGVAY
jgi:hypothetical protein